MIWISMNLNMVGILFTCGNMNASLLRREVWTHKTSLITPHFIDVHVLSQESGRSWICALSASISTRSTTVSYFLFFILCLSELVCCREELCQAKNDVDEPREMSDTQKEEQDKMIKEYVYIFNCYCQKMYGDDQSPHI